MVVVFQYRLTALGDYSKFPSFDGFGHDIYIYIVDIYYAFFLYTM